MHKASSGYDDEPGSRYHFPATYRNLVAASEGEWLVYYEPRREGGREAYVAVARLGAMWPDEKLEGHYYVGISDHKEFTNVVPWRVDEIAMEAGLQKIDGSTNKGQFGRAVRRLSMAEFQEIERRGFVTAYEESAIPVPVAADGDFALVERQVVESVVARKVRDRAFMINVRNAYSQTCAFTGLRVVNGGGWTEMEAAHIRPVEHQGPDLVQNGLALSRTMHALFDRGFLTLSNEYQIIESTRAPLPDQLRGLLVAGRTALIPSAPNLKPHRTFLEFHRNQIFKGA